MCPTEERKSALALEVRHEPARFMGDARVDRDDPVPLYHQLYRILLDKITSGAWRPGDLIPSEKELGQQYQSSRITIRQTLQQLAADGYLSREQGRGTFVAEPKMRGVQGFASFTDDMRNRGLIPGSKIINQEIPASIVYEDDELLAFKDINPVAPLHVLIVPKKEIPTINDLNERKKG